MSFCGQPSISSAGWDHECEGALHHLLVPEALRSGLTLKLNLIFEGRGVGKPVSVGKVVRFW